MKIRLQFDRPFAEYLAEYFADAETIEIRINGVNLATGKIDATFEAWCGEQWER